MLNRSAGKRRGCLNAAQIQFFHDFNDCLRHAQVSADKDPMRLNHPLIFLIVKSMPYRSMGNRLLPP
jgi:hypothetical protein